MAWELMSRVKIDSVVELVILSSTKKRRLKGLPS